MTPEQFIARKASEAIKAVYGADADPATLQVSVTRKEFEGDFTLVVFPLLRMSHSTPENTGNAIGEWLVANVPEISRFNCVKGFLNLLLSNVYWNELFKEIATDPDFGQLPPTGRNIMVEFSSPNTNKPLHLGHIRNNLLGDSVSRLLKASGNNVLKATLVNDRGIHICKSMLAWLKWGNGETPESSGKKGDHLIGDYYVAFDKHYREEVKQLVAQGMDEETAKQEAPLIKEAHEMLVKWEQNDPEVRALWKKMNDWVYAGFDETYKALGVGFDKIYYESQTYLEGKEKVEEGLAKGVFYRKDDNSVWADLTPDGLDHKLLLRSDGTSVYMTQDIGTAKLRYQDYPIDKMIYVVGNEQNYHFQVLSLLLDKLGFKWGKDLIHFSYGMVELPHGKMKSREGTVVDADDLMDKMVDDAMAMTSDRLEGMTIDEKREVARIIGMGALKYFILKVDPRKNMLFNPAESIDFNGNTGPFIQYTYARIRSLQRKAGDNMPALDVNSVTPNDKEIAIIQRIADFASVVEEAGHTYSPALIANYTYELAKEFNQFYHDYSILKEEDENLKVFRLELSRTVAGVIKRAFSLLGIEVPERM